MKIRFAVFFLLAFSAATAFAQGLGLHWNPPVTVADGSQFGNSWPRLALTSGDVPVVSWGSITGKTMYVARFNGTGFDTPVEILPAGKECFVANWAGPDIAAAGDTVFAVWKQLPFGSGPVGLARSLDGGQTFSTPVAVDNIGSDISDFPALSVRAGGNPVVTFMRLKSGWTEPDYVVSQSTDGGMTFMADVDAGGLAPGEACDCCPAEIAVSGNTQVVAFRNNENNIRDTWMALTNDAGVTFDTAVRVDQNGWFIQSCPSTGPDVAIAGDSIVTVWMTGASGTSQVHVNGTSKSTLQQGFQHQIQSIPTGGQTAPRVTAKGDTVAVVWQDNRLGDHHCYISWSVSGPAGLRDQGSLCSAPAANTAQGPDILFNDGVFHLVYRDLGSGDVLYRTATIGTATGGPQVTNALSLRVFPNPASDHFNIEISGTEGLPASVRLLDLSGKVIRVHAMHSGIHRISTENMAAGVYLVEVSSVLGAVRRKIAVR